MSTVAEALAIAIEHHKAGRLPVAEQIYRQILAVVPGHADALHLMGVVALQRGRHDIAAEYVERAIAVQAGSPSFHNTLAEAYRGCGRLPQAIAACRRALALKPDYPEAHNNLGNALREAGDPAGATAAYRRALELNPNLAEARNNLGNMLKDAGKLDEAVACYRRALELHPNYADALGNLGNALAIQGKLDEALPCYHRAIELNPYSAGVRNNLGNALRDLGRLDEAVAAFRCALELAPNYAEAHANLANALKDQGKLDESLACYRRALELKPGLAEGENNLGNLLKAQGKPAEAAECYRRALAARPDFAEAHSNLGDVLQEMGKTGEALACYRRAVEAKPGLVEAQNKFGNLLREQGHLDEAVACYRRALALKPESACFYTNLGNALKDQLKTGEAVACFRRALELQPDYVDAHGSLGIALMEMGDFPAAEDAFRTALRHDPAFVISHFKLAELLGAKLPADEIAAQRRLLDPAAAPDTPGPGGKSFGDAQRLLLHFSLAQVLDARGEYAEAAAHLEQGNALQLADWRKRGREYDPQEHEQFISRMISVCTPDFFARVGTFGLPSELPVFVVGLPRSGTTLVEQVLASHSQVFGAGELTLAANTMASLGGHGGDAFDGLGRIDRHTAQQLAARYLEQLRAMRDTALRVVGKMPENYLYLGLLAMLFPRARFIHCRRDLRDVAVSCWLTHFAETRWANDRGHIAERFLQHERIMEHWRKALPVPLLEIDYEEMVGDAEAAARRLVAWCGLEWEPACLEHHRGQRVVRTASAVQVRRPIYRTSVGRWKRYEEALGTLFARLEEVMAGSERSSQSSSALPR